MFREGHRHQQYQNAHLQVPLQRTKYYNSAGSDHESRINDRALTDGSHTLRRKTPNGTLAAGYDGSPSDRSAGPYGHRLDTRDRPLHSASQTLAADRAGDNAGWTTNSMPISEGKQCYQNPLAETSRQYQCSERVPNNSGHFETQHTPWDNHSRSFQREKPGGIFNDRLPVQSGWGHQMLHVQGLDSVLNQGPIAQQPYLLGDGHQIPSLLQPMWPPCLGSATSNSPGLNGPYWPDGASVPYRPFAVRDPQLTTTVKDDEQGHYPREQSELHPEDWTHRGFPVTGSQIIDSTSIPSQHQPSLLPDEKRKDFAEYPADRSQASLYAPASYTGEREVIIHREEQTSSGWNPLLKDFPLSTYPGSTDLGGRLGNAPFKETLLVWAHRVYVSLLASIHRSRRNLQGVHLSNEKQNYRMNFYPKPPRQIRSSPLFRRSLDAQGTNSNSLGPHRLESQTIYPSSDGYSMNDDLTSQYDWQPDSQTYGTSNMRSHKHLTLPQLGSQHSRPLNADALSALDMLARLCQEDNWQWIEGMLLGGCLAYGLGDYTNAMKWYSQVLSSDPNNVEALSNFAATLLSVNRREEAEQYWLRTINLRPSYFEAIEQLVGLLCADHRGKEAVQIIEHVEQALRGTRPRSTRSLKNCHDALDDCNRSPAASMSGITCSGTLYPASKINIFNLENETSTPLGFGSSGYAISAADNHRMLALVHAKGNILYALGDNSGAACAFEDAILIAAGRRKYGIHSLIRQILNAFTEKNLSNAGTPSKINTKHEPILLVPEMALRTAELVFADQGSLPGLLDVPNGNAKKAALSTTSNSLLSLAKIYQDGISSSGATATGPKAASGVQEILALYYLSLSLQPSPSTANNVGILLASVQQSMPAKLSPAFDSSKMHHIPGVVPGSGIALALAYYNYGLNLDSHHAHLYTNLGSLLKDIGQLGAAINMYERAVECDGKFDIALANLANAVKDQGRISDAIEYYQRAVRSNPDFAEAVCGLANALNSVCKWDGRGGIVVPGSVRDRWHVNDQGMLIDAKYPQAVSSGWIERVVSIVEKQLKDGENWGRGIINAVAPSSLLEQLGLIGEQRPENKENMRIMMKALQDWAGNDWEGARVVRLVERATRQISWQWYHDRYIDRRPHRPTRYTRPQLPSALAIPSAPTVLPFHTFTCPLSAEQIRKISQRNGLRISCSTLRAQWLPVTVYEPPNPPDPLLKIGYVSSDFNNHPLAHLMQSTFGYHDKARFRAFCYATTASDNSIHRQQIEREAPVFYDVSSWSVERLVNQIVDDGIHILINLNGYTRGARNEVFAARPAPIQMSFMGFAGTLGAEWCDYLLADRIAIPAQTLRPWRRNVNLTDQAVDGNNDVDQEHWVYGENIIFTRDTFFCCDHRQSAPDAQGGHINWYDEQRHRWRMRKSLFPHLPDDAVILGNFNQLYKIEPTTFRIWLRILSRVPNAVLWLLRFPDLGESHLRKTASDWAGAHVASRILFTDVAPKHEHISRARICDLFLDTPECNAHTTAADILWSGTPLLTLPRHEYKMCSRMAASILTGALPKDSRGERAAEELIVCSDEEYEDRAVALAATLLYDSTGESPGIGRGRLAQLRKLLYESRWTSALFDTRRWVKDLEEAYEEAWRRWVVGEGGDIWL